eukprot:TRINITY_DN56798_c0_g1_i1.p1 TRINITY_DN56798_c0_g1~~TRINITY_DN56798_c0_g1_i1.p1  ORF type:complete len:241 (-),score=40.96 TRINITY_DN56798_c0_g1_i1:42-764(-)
MKSMKCRKLGADVAARRKKASAATDSEPKDSEDDSVLEAASSTRPGNSGASCAERNALPRRMCIRLGPFTFVDNDGKCEIRSQDWNTWRRRARAEAAAATASTSSAAPPAAEPDVAFLKLGHDRKRGSQKETVDKNWRRHTAYGPLAKKQVMFGYKVQTVGRLKKDQLMLNKRRRIVSVKASAAAKKRSGSMMKTWGEAVLRARKELRIVGWCPVGGVSDIGKALHIRAMEIKAMLTASK